MEKILVIGALGQLGSELTQALGEIFGESHVLGSDIKPPSPDHQVSRYYQVDALDKEAIARVVKKESITQIYHLAAILSAKGEQNPPKAWDINMTTLLNVLEIARKQNIKVYWPSSIAVFGPTTPKDNTPQFTVMDPNTVYGISKLAGERWCEYYFQKYNVDIRSLRYPGLIGWRALPGGGTTDYAVDIYHYALKNEPYTCFLKEDTVLPMMYMDDAVRGTIELMQCDPSKIKIRSSYNIAALSFSPKDIASSIRNEIENFHISYEPDFRQNIADSWPSSIDDSHARNDWNWNPEYDLQTMTKTMLKNLESTFKIH